MSKYKTTKREILNNETQIISFGYCDIQRIERHIEPILYTKSIYGWSCDGYRLKNGWLLTTGYNPIERIILFTESNEDFKRLNKERLEEVATLKQNIKELEQHLKNNDLNHEQAKELISKYFVNVW